MNEFKVLSVLNTHTITVSPSWTMSYNNTTFKGNKINIRGLEEIGSDNIFKQRLEKILIAGTEKIYFDSPELCEYTNPNDATVSCSIFIGRTNILYYFPELVHRH